jgi:NAD(P)H-hydrate epimerase
MAVTEVTGLPELPPRARDAHKGQFGRVLIVAGSPGMTGAACLAASGAQRAGAGLVTLAVPHRLHAIAEAKTTSVMTRPLPGSGGLAIDEEAAERVLEWAGEFDVAALGPGVGRAAETQAAMVRLVRELPIPAVVDADGLNAVAGDPACLDDAAAPRVLTPHPGEMARLLGHADTGRVQADRIATATAFAAEHGAVVVLKGADTVVTDGERFRMNATGNPGMATGGTGDVLTGLVVGLIGQGLEPFGAASLAAHVHGLAGDLAAGSVGELSLIAEDVLEAVPQAFMLTLDGGSREASE